MVAKQWLSHRVDTSGFFHSLYLDEFHMVLATLGLSPDSCTADWPQLMPAWIDGLQAYQIQHDLELTLLVLLPEPTFLPSAMPRKYGCSATFEFSRNHSEYFFLIYVSPMWYLGHSDTKTLSVVCLIA